MSDLKMKEAIEQIIEKDLSRSQDEISAELERYVRNDQRMRIIPYLYPYYSYLMPVKDDEGLEEKFKVMWNTRRYDSKDVALYIHIPFCTQKCDYCQWYTIVQPQSEFETYTNLLIKEIELYSRNINLEDKRISTIYFGGGTPNLLSIEQLTRIVEALNKNFNLNKVGEFTVEVFPYRLTARNISSLKELGVTRISMGIQTFDQGILSNELKRKITSAEQKYLDVVSTVKANGMVLNLDMLSDLPKYTYNQLKNDVESIIFLNPDQIAYAYTEYRQAPINVLSDSIPNYVLRKSGYYTVSERLTNAGYIQADENQFTRPDSPMLWFDMRSISSVEIALGPRARGFTCDGTIYRNGDYSYWKGCLESNKLPIQNAHNLIERELLNRFLLFGVFYGRIDSDEFKERFTIGPEELMPNTFSSLMQLGMLDSRDKKYSKYKKYYNYRKENSLDRNMLEFTEMGKHYLEAIRILLTDKTYRRRIQLEQTNEFYKKIYSNLISKA